jgi:uncharacterized membrane protein
MPWTFVVIEWTVLLLGVQLVFHARRQGARWLSTCLWGMAFGTAVELMIVSRASASYGYGEFLFMLGPAGKQVPLWVGVGWGVIVYAATWTAQRMQQPWLLRPLSAGILAVSVDLSLDPIAQCLGYWKWKDPPLLNYYGVPFDNFLGWFAIVASFALLTRAGFRWVPPGVKWSSFWVPPVAGLAALLVMALLQAGIGYLYGHLPGGQTTVFVLVFGFAGVNTWSYLVHSRRDQPINWSVLAVPLTMHGLLIVLLFATRSFEQPLLTSLIVALPTNFVASLFGFAWASIDVLFLEKRRSLSR